MRLYPVILALALARPAAGQAARHSHLEGEWEAKASDGLHYVMVRADSSAQFGEQVARWRVVGDSIWFTLGDGAWQVYGLKVSGEKLTLSGGDLDKPVTLRRVNSHDGDRLGRRDVETRRDGGSLGEPKMLGQRLGGGFEAVAAAHAPR